MKAFEIWTWQPPKWDRPHPVVIVSHPARVANKPEVNVIACQTQRAARAATPEEIILDEADGLDWSTICRCDLVYLVEKSALQNRRGVVSRGRRYQIINTLNRAMGWV